MIKILFLAANPSDTTRLRLDEENRAIDQALRHAELREEFKVEQHWAVRVSDLQGLLLRHQPDIVHFSGHGSEAGEIIVEDNLGNSHPVSVSALGGLFSLLKDNVRCVVLNACYSEEQAHAIAQHIDCVVGMSGAIGDTASVSFAAAFYQALGYGRGVQQAFDLGCLQIDLENLAEEETPRLLTIGRNLEKLKFVLECPYPGMRPFSEAQSDTFFGRDAEIQEAIERLLLHPFLTVIGPSGSGKSSLVFAGVLPALRKRRRFGSKPWVIQTMRPGVKPLATFNALLPDNNDGNAQKHLLLIVDQFEETFTSAGDEAQPFQEKLLQLIQGANIYVILTVRADFYSDLMTSPLWPHIKAHRLEVTPLGKEELRQTIVRPAETMGVAIETALVERLLDEAAGEPGVLPLVQETLVQLWEYLDRHFLPLNAYDALVPARGVYSGTGRTGLQVAVARRADVTLTQLSAEGQAIARRTFLRLVQFGKGRADTRRQQSVAELKAAGDDSLLFEKTLQHLTDNRLLTLSSNESGTIRFVDISHEALINGWPQLQIWIRERREAEQTRRRFEARAIEWEQIRKRQGGLLDEIELMEVERWLASSHAIELGNSESLAELITASRHVQLELEKQKQRNTYFRFGAVTVVVALIVLALAISYDNQNRIVQQQAEATAAFAAQKANAAATIEVQATAEAVALIAVQTANAAEFAERANAAAQMEIAQINARRTKAETLVAQAQNRIREMGYIDDVAVILARDAIKVTYGTGDGFVTESSMYLLNQLIMNRHVPDTRLPKHGHDLSFSSFAWSPDHRHFVTGSWDTTAKVWNYADGEARLTLSGHRMPVTSVAWSPNGAQIVTGSFDGIAKIWNAVTGEETLALSGHGCNERNRCGIRAVTWSPDSRYMVSGGDDGVGKVWNTQSATEEVTLKGHADTIVSVAWSPDGGRIVTGSLDRTARVWDAATGTELLTLDNRDALDIGRVWQVAWSPNSKYIATLNGSHTAKIWNTELSTEVVTLRGHTDNVNAVAWSPDGAFIATGSSDGVAKIWNAETGKEIRTLSSHNARVDYISWNPTGTQVITAGSGVVKAWNVATGDLERIVLDGLLGTGAVAWSPDGTKILTTDGIWDVNSVKKLLDLNSSDTEITSVAWSPDGARFLTGSQNGTARIWDANRGEVLSTLNHPTDRVGFVNWNAGGTQFLTWVNSDTAEVWEVLSGERLVTLREHDGRVEAAAWSPDGSKLVTGSSNGSAYVWDMKTGDKILNLTGHDCHEHIDDLCDVSAVAWSPDGARIVTGSVDGTAKVWDSQTGGEVFTLSARTGWIKSVVWSPSGAQIVTGSSNGIVQVWDSKAGLELQILAGHFSRIGDLNDITTLAWSPDGTRILTGDENGTAMIWNLTIDPKQVILSIPASFPSESEPVAWSPDGKMILTATGIWDASSGIQLYDYPVPLGRRYPVNSAAWSPDGTQILIGTYGGPSHRWDEKFGTQRLTVNILANQHPVSWSPNGEFIAAVGWNNPAAVWDDDIGIGVKIITLDTSDVTSVAWSPDGNFMGIAKRDGTSEIRNIKTDVSERILRGPGDSTRAIAWSPDGDRIITGSADGTAIIWDVETGVESRVLSSHNDSVNAVRWSPDGDRIITGSADGTAIIWHEDSGIEQRVLRAGREWKCEELFSSCGVTAVAWSPDGSRIAIGSSEVKVLVWDPLIALESLIVRNAKMLLESEGL